MCLYVAPVQPRIDEELEPQTLRMKKFADKPVVRDPEDRWFDLPEVELGEVEPLEPAPERRLHIPLTLLAIGVLVAGAAFLWT